MRIRRLILPFLLLALTRGPSSAQIVAASAGSASEAGASAAAAGAFVSPALPLSYQARIMTGAPTLAAGPAYLADSNAQEWFKKNRPDLVPALTRRALELSDWTQVLTEYQDPRLMREALLSRPDSELALDPKGLLALVDRTPALAERRPLIAAAVLDWAIISEETRSLLAADGIDEEVWSGMGLPLRYENLRHEHARWIQRAITAAPGTAEYSAQYEQALKRTSGLMTNEELADRKRDLKQAQEIAAALQRAREAVAKAGNDAESAGLLKAAEDAQDFDEIARLLAPLHRRLGLDAPPAPAAPEPRLNLNITETRMLSESFYAAIVRELKGEPIGEEVADFLARNPSRFKIGRVPFAALGVIDPVSGDITVDEKSFAQAAAALGHSPLQLIEDPAGMREMAIVFGHILVHETTHARQHDWADKRLGRKVPGVYSQQWEFEAYAAQGAFLRAKMRSDPAYASVAERLLPVGGALGSLLLTGDLMDERPDDFRRGIIHSYRRIPTLARAGARLIKAGQQDEVASAPAIEVELALRRLQDRGVETESWPNKYSGLSTRRLRELRRAMSNGGAAMTAFVEELLARSGIELARLSRGLPPVAVR